MRGDRIEGFEWAQLVLSGLVAAYCAVGAIYVMPKLSQTTFNGIWRTRLLVQITAFLLAMCQLLPLALWDGKHGVIRILPSDFNREVLCKIFTVAALGVFQPFLLLLGCFLCTHALRDSAPNLRKLPILNAALVMIPFAAGQVLAAFWSTWLEGTVNSEDEIGRLPFSTFSHVPCPGYDDPYLLSSGVTAVATGNTPANISAMSPATMPSNSEYVALLVEGLDAPAPAMAEAAAAAVGCISCKYTFSSVVVHVVLTLTFTVIIATFGRVMLDCCGNKVLRNRIRLLCLLLPVLQALQCGSAGVTVIKRHPYTWAHEIGKFVAFVCVISLIAAVCTLLVIMPLHAAASALRMVAKLEMYDDGYPEAQPSSGTLGLHSDGAVLLPTGRSRSKASAGGSIGLPAAAPLLENIGLHPAGGDSGGDSGEEAGGGGGGMLQPGFEVGRRAKERAAAYVVEQGPAVHAEDEPSLRFGMA
eukprot:jgi/Ulvmu1/4263/UM194_0003.1